MRLYLFVQLTSYFTCNRKTVALYIMNYERFTLKYKYKFYTNNTLIKSYSFFSKTYLEEKSKGSLIYFYSFLRTNNANYYFMLIFKGNFRVF